MYADAGGPDEMIHRGIDQAAHQKVAAIATIVEIARNGHPSRAIMGWGYEFIGSLVVSRQPLVVS